MVPTPQAQAILLLTASLGRAAQADARPLSNGEWTRFAIWLKQHDLAPDSLLAEQGGTWNGAVENLDADWVPLWVRRTDSSRSGNSELVRRGARWLPSRLGPNGLVAWLARGVAEHRVRRLAKPVRYRAVHRGSGQATLLRDGE